MSKIWLTSDTHFCHDKEFIYKARGFNSVEDMRIAIIQNWNCIVKPDDIVYHLGDVALVNIDFAIDTLKLLNGKIRLAIGNHDTPNRIARYKALGLFDDIQFGYEIKYHKKRLLLTHYPQLTGNLDGSKTYSIHGHTHSTSAFCEYDLMYNVGCDAHNCSLVALDDMIAEIDAHKNKILEARNN